MSDTITSKNAEDWASDGRTNPGFGEYRKKALTRISNFTVPPGTVFQTPEGLKAEDEWCRIAFDVQGGVYPIRESVFEESYEPVREGYSDAEAAADQAEL